MDVTLTSSGQSFTGQALDLSLGGLRVRFDQGDTPPPNHEFKTHLVFRSGGAADTQVKVVWAMGRQAGLSFSGPAHPRVMAFTHLESKRKN